MENKDFKVKNKQFIYWKNLIESLNPRNNIESIFKAGESQGKSGSFFFFSQDKKFIIKTMTDSDYLAF